MYNRREQLEADFLAGRLEGQKRKPTHFWCERCEGSGRLRGKPVTDCPACGGSGVVEKGVTQ